METMETIAAPLPPLYQPLSTNELEIRLLRVVSSLDSEMIECVLEIFKLDRKLVYKALSYAWVHLVKVRTNLFDFLQVFKLRIYVDRLLIWIDQLCINQNDVLEKNAQVAQMEKIYRGASETIAWLGRGDDDRGLGFATINKLCLSFRGKTLSSSETATFADRLSEYPRSELKALDDVFTRQYWRRHWIAQELLVSRNVSIRYGEFAFQWRELVRLVSLLHRSSHPMRPTLGRFDALAMLAEMQILKHYRGLLPGDTWTYSTKYARASSCYDPRDKVYGIQSLLPDSFRIVIDYKKSVLDVYLDTAYTLGMLAMRTGTRVLYKRQTSDLAAAMGLHVKAGLDKDLEDVVKMLQGNVPFAFRIEMELRDLLSKYVSEDR